MTSYQAPRLLSETDSFEGFCCGLALVDDWVKNHAAKATKGGTARIYVVRADGESRIAGFYALSAHSLVRDEVGGGWLSRNAPVQVPAILLGMLGVDTRHRGNGLGRSLLLDAIERAVSVSRQIGSRALIVDPATEKLAAFYASFGFAHFREGSRIYLPLA